MTTINGGCGCGGGMEQSTGNVPGATKVRQVTDSKIKPGLIDRKVTLLIAAGAAMAANCEPCLKRIIPDLKEAKVSDDEIRSAIVTGQFVKDRAAAIMKDVADTLAGAHIGGESATDFCPGDTMKKDTRYKVMMLIAAGAAMGANCEYCLNRIVPDLIEAGVSETDMRRAVEIGQFVKDKPAAVMKEAADVLTGSKLSDKSSSSGECPADKTKQAPGSGCCS
ncbi:MAG: carboxymuconolactone decarboxylase family protein [Candidatus Lindowbacteria bacterium]|nr:carboxymuconolactone decarboxylase family protein [Candidatus Lindowbacteria bacterium]